jgi:hypothetical protein
MPVIFFLLAPLVIVEVYFSAFIRCGNLEIVPQNYSL